MHRADSAVRQAMAVAGRAACCVCERKPHSERFDSKYFLLNLI